MLDEINGFPQNIQQSRIKMIETINYQKYRRLKIYFLRNIIFITFFRNKIFQFLGRWDDSTIVFCVQGLDYLLCSLGDGVLFYFVFRDQIIYCANWEMVYYSILCLGTRLSTVLTGRWCTILFCVQGLDYLLCSLGDGALFYFQLTKQGSLIDKRKVIIKTLVLLLITKKSEFRDSGILAKFFLCSTLIY